MVHHHKYPLFYLWPWGQGYTKCCPVPTSSCDLCTCKVWSCYIQRFRQRSIYKKIQYLTLTLASRSLEILPSTLYTMWAMHLRNLKLLSLMVSLGGAAFIRKNNMRCFPVLSISSCYLQQLRRNALTGKCIIRPLTLGSRSHKMLPSTLYVMWPIELQSLKLLHLMV